jgi:hypothetical protein
MLDCVAMSKKSGRSAPARRRRIQSVHVDRIAETLANSVLSRPDLLAELEVAALEAESTAGEGLDTEVVQLQRAAELEPAGDLSNEPGPGDDGGFTIEVMAGQEASDDPPPAPPEGTKCSAKTTS